MELPKALLEELEEVRNLLTPESLWQKFDGDDYDVQAVKVSNLLKLQDLWISQLNKILEIHIHL